MASWLLPATALLLHAAQAPLQAALLQRCTTQWAAELLRWLLWRLPLQGTTGTALARRHVPQRELSQPGARLLLAGRQGDVLRLLPEPREQLQAQREARRMSDTAVTATSVNCIASASWQLQQPDATHHVFAWHLVPAARLAGLDHRSAAEAGCCEGAGQRCRGDSLCGGQCGRQRRRRPRRRAGGRLQPYKPQVMGCAHLSEAPAETTEARPAAIFRQSSKLRFLLPIVDFRQLGACGKR